MTVKDIIASALTLLGRADLVSALSDDALNGEGQELVNTLLYCYNAVEDELARKYIPLTATEERFAGTKHFYYRAFAHYPVKFKRILVNGEPVEYQLFTEYVAVDSKEIVAEYEYAPKRKTLDGTSDYGDEVGVYLFALGIASEYSVINGEAEMAEIWEKKYRAQLDGLQRTLPACGSIPPRRWI